jgi:hypothetical protein
MARLEAVVVEIAVIHDYSSGIIKTIAMSVILVTTVQLEILVEVEIRQQQKLIH